ncbi:MAG: sulfite exporter TauE/SafE family protein, partial [Spirochaetaceae bacterium]
MSYIVKSFVAILLLLVIAASPAVAQSSSSLITAELPWWGWALLLFVFTFFLGVIAVIGGVGGGVLFVPIVSAVFPFHFDFVRGAGLLVALCGALSAAPYLLRTGLASMRLGLPMALFGSVGSIIGAAIGLALPIGIVETLLGVTILGIVAIMISASRSDFPVIKKPDPLGAMFGIRGSYLDTSLGTTVEWRVHRTALALMSYV